MSKFLISIIGTLIIGEAFATGENIPTSKSYVDAEIATKQNKIAANDGTVRVLTNTGIAGEIGTKGIYDASGEYGAQSDALVDAVTMNSAVQNAIDSEFQCIEYNPNDPTDCWLMDVFGQTGKPSGKNLFDINNSRIIYQSSGNITVDKISNGLTITYVGETSSGSYSFAMVELGNINDFLGKTLIISATRNCINGGIHTESLTMCNDDCSVRKTSSTRTITIPQQPEAGFTKIAFRLYATAGGAGTNPACTYTDIQVEEGSVATAYEPYTNLYIPSGN